MALVAASSSESDDEPIDYGFGVVHPPQALRRVVEEPLHGQGALVDRSAAQQHLVAGRAREGRSSVGVSAIRKQQGVAMHTAVAQLRKSGALRPGVVVGVHQPSRVSCSSLVVHVGSGMQSGRRPMLSPHDWMSITYNVGLAIDT